MRTLDALPAANAAPMVDASVRRNLLIIALVLAAIPLIAAIVAGFAR